MLLQHQQSTVSNSGKLQRFDGEFVLPSCKLGVSVDPGKEAGNIGHFGKDDGTLLYINLRTSNILTLDQAIVNFLVEVAGQHFGQRLRLFCKTDNLFKLFLHADGDIVEILNHFIHFFIDHDELVVFAL